MKYAQFYTMSVGYDGKHPSKPIEYCGSDGVLLLDGRLSFYNMVTAATKASVNKAGIVGFKLMSGERFSTARPISDYLQISEE